MTDVKLPEPFAWYKTHHFRSSVDYTYTHNKIHAEDWSMRGEPLSKLYTAAQMLAIHEQGRLAGLEEAAKLYRDTYNTSSGDTYDRAIRAIAASDGGKG